jgi:hypothetical protein
MRRATALSVLVAIACVTTASAEGRKVEGVAYLDASWLGSPNRPDNRTWRTKGTSWKLDGVEIFNASAYATKTATADSRWGFSAGVQTGWDVDKLAGDGAVSWADWAKHLYYTYASYLFPVGHGLEVNAGFIPGNLGHESFHAIDNATYTREYGVDLVPYYEIGLWGTWTISRTVSLGLLVVDGWNYLDRTNEVPSYAAQLIWDITPTLQLKQNLYAGPEQENTALEYWRFVTQTMAQWTVDDFMFVLSVAWGTEDQDLPTGARGANWAWTALWATWQLDERWQVTVRPEIYDDPDGVGSGYRQTLTGLTVGGEYRIAPVKMNTLSARVEYRYDRSTGPEGGFYEGDLNALTPDQHLFILALMWRLDTGN